jgi:hypothetical protein
MELLSSILRDFPDEAVPLTKIQEELRKTVPSVNAAVWLKSLNLPSTALKDAKPGNRRAGKLLVVKHVIGASRMAAKE